jgi:hypothetical protein
MDYFKLFKAQNMVALMLDPWFKNLNLVGDYVGYFFAIDITIAYDKRFLLPPSKLCIKSTMDGQMLFNCCARNNAQCWCCFLSRSVWRSILFSTTIVFFTFLKNIVSWFASSFHTSNYLIWALCRFGGNCHAFAHLMCPWKLEEAKDPLL